MGIKQIQTNKKIPAGLTFEERKTKFVHTAEWNGRIRQLNKHLEENELTEDNLQKEIDHAGIEAGMELEQNFENEFVRKCFNDGYCEIMLDKGNIKYN